MKNVFKKARWVLIPAAAVACVWFIVVKFEFEKPAIRLAGDTPYLGRELVFRVSDRKSGLAEVRVEADQAGRTIELFSEKFVAAVPVFEKKLALRPIPAGLMDGDVQIRITARDRSWKGGNRAVLEKKMILDSRPPRMTILGDTPNVSSGGTGVAVYTVDEETTLSGLQVGDDFFPGFSDGGNRFVVYYAVPEDSSTDLPFIGVAEDRAGNRTNTAFHPTMKIVPIKKDTLTLSDKFLADVIPYFKNLDPNLKGTDLDIFLEVNRKERAADFDKIREACRNTAPKALWSGAFLRLPRSKTMASFGEHRTYLYEGKPVDTQIHLGVDLASIKQCPIPAANAGRVIFAGPLGIYGLTVMLDHGLGLFSMYSHLSRIDLDASKDVAKGEILGRSGSTGMAGGDHLHFAMLVHGVFVNPVEWWDAHWIHDNVENKIMK